MSTGVKKIKDYFYYKSEEGVVSITSNTSTWHAVPSKKKMKVTKFEVDCTLKEIPEGDSPSIIRYKKRKGFFIPKD